MPEHGPLFLRPDGQGQGSSAPPPRDLRHRFPRRPRCHSAMVTGWTAALSPSTLRTRPLKSLPPGRQNGRSRARLSRAQGDLPHHQRHRKCVRPQFPGLSPGGLGPHLTSSGFPLQAFLRFPVCPPGPPLRPPSSGFPSSGFLRFVPFGRCPGSGPPPGSLPLSNLHVSAAVRRFRRRWSRAARTNVTSPARPPRLDRAIRPPCGRAAAGHDGMSPQNRLLRAAASAGHRRAQTAQIGASGAAIAT